MAEISRIGCAIEDQESEIGCPGAGNPILDLTSGVIAAIAVAVQARKSDWPFETPQPERQFSTTPAMFNTAISVAGTTAQIRSEEFTYFGQLVRQTAADISRALGFMPVKIESSGQ
jgi:DNA-binding IclR family transcriptional regulator